MEIGKTVSWIISRNQAQKDSTCITFNVSFVFNTSSIAVSTLFSFVVELGDDEVHLLAMLFDEIGG